MRFGVDRRNSTLFLAAILRLVKDMFRADAMARAAPGEESTRSPIQWIVMDGHAGINVIQTEAHVHAGAGLGVVPGETGLPLS